MLGNVYEWCQERYVENPGTTAAALRADEVVGDSHRLLRGTSFLSQPSFVRSANRYRNAPSILDTFLGFRVVRTER